MKYVEEERRREQKKNGEHHNMSVMFLESEKWDEAESIVHTVCTIACTTTTTRNNGTFPGRCLKYDE